MNIGSFYTFIRKNLVVVVMDLCIQVKSVFVKLETKLNWNWNYEAICYQQCVCCLCFNLFLYCMVDFTDENTVTQDDFKPMLFRLVTEANVAIDTDSVVHYFENDVYP